MHRYLWCVIMSLVGTTAILAQDVNFPGSEGSDPWQFRPNDPKYPNMWHVFSHIPPDQRAVVEPWDRKHGSGMNIDKAWQLHIGDSNTLIAILDSGIKWQESDLLERYFLNQKELPLPQGSKVYDANGDGRFSVSDYHNDPRVYDVNNNGVIDPGDLIAIFSNGIDEDGNGYVDDIAGWDFHEHDNDPWDRVNFGHGTGEAKDSVATINNGIGGAGACGACSVMFLRLNDSFIVDANAFAKALVYAADMRVDVVQQALGSLNSSDFVQAAVDYATAKDVVIIGSAADEHSYHHNYPSTLDPIIYTNAVRYDAREFQDATTFVNFNNCSNYGARVDVATSGRACSSEATGNLSGIVALARSYAKKLGKQVDALQLSAILKGTVDDIAIAGSENDPRKHPTYPGWDMMTGYGRTNAYALLDAIRQDKIPVSLRLLTPRWFELFKNNADVALRAEVKYARHYPLRFAVLAQRGIQENDAIRTTVWSTTIDRINKRQRHNFEIPIQSSMIAALADNPQTSAAFKSAVTFIFRVTDAKGIVAEQRRTVFILPEEGMRKGFPLQAKGSLESGVTLVDIDGDQVDEVVFGDGKGWLHVVRGDGSAVPGFPLKVAPSAYAHENLGVEVGAAIFAPLAVTKVDSEGRRSIVVATLEGHLAVVDAQGNMWPGFPVQLPAPSYQEVNEAQILAQGITAAPVVADLDGDGYEEVIAVGLNGGVFAFDQRGKLKKGFPYYPEVGGKRAKLVSSPSVFDLDKDGKMELIFGTSHVGAESGYVFAYSPYGVSGAKTSDGFPVRIPIIRDAILPTVGTGITAAPLVGDFDEDGNAEIVIHGFIGKTYIISNQGKLVRSLQMNVGRNHQTNDEFMLSGFGHPGVARFGQQLSITGVGVGRRILTNLLLGGVRFDFQHMLSAWNLVTGKMLQLWPKPTEDMMLFISPVAVDVDGDGNDELWASSGGYFLSAYSNASRRTGLSKFTGGWATSAPSFGDVAGDQHLTVGIGTREGYVFLWNLGPKPSRLRFTWPTFKGNLARTGAWKGVHNEVR